ncbi:hypothetical protein MTP99_007586 [Tenebrio molitor]|nr:hypothetical protein MTP99_007586 [Tenebrio molitor]
MVILMRCPCQHRDALLRRKIRASHFAPRHSSTREYYYDPKDPEGRAGHKTQIRCPDWGAEGREIQTFEGQHNIYFCPVYTGAVCPVPAPRRVRCRAGLVTPRFRYLMIESWFSGTLKMCRRRSSSGVGARFLPGRALPGWCLHEVVWLGEGETVNRKILETR